MPRQNLSLLDILSLCALVASAQQDHNLRPAGQIVDPVTRPVGDPHFHDTLTDASAVPGISLFHATNAGDYARDRIGIPETAQPGRKLLGLTRLDHVVYGLQAVKREMEAQYREIGGFRRR